MKPTYYHLKDLLLNIQLGKSRKKLSVVISYQSEYMFVILEEYNVINEDKYDAIRKMFISHGWQILYKCLIGF